MITCIIRYHIDPTKKAEFESWRYPFRFSSLRKARR